MVHTFYSFKGGVGRSMALANVAEYFRRKGLNVVVIDWDMEAPGLENYFYPEAELEKIRAGAGLLDLLLAYQRAFPQLALLRTASRATERLALAVAIDSAAQEETSPFLREPEETNGAQQSSQPELTPLADVLDEHLPPLSTFLHNVPPLSSDGDGESDGDAPTAGTVRLLTAGWRDAERFSGYAQDVQSFDWARFYSHYEGEAFFEWLRERLEQIADVVLIDSRTGVTEMSGICTRQLADVIVAVCTPNLKTIDSMLRVTDSFRPDRRPDLRKLRPERPIKTIIVPTRLETTELDRRNAFERDFTERLRDLRPREFAENQIEFWDLQIPYIAAYTYQETLVVGAPGRDKSLEAAYRRLAAHLALLAPESSPLRLMLNDEVKRQFRDLTPRVYLSYATHDGRRFASAFRARLQQAHIEIWPDIDAIGTGASVSSEAAARIAQSEYIVFLLTPSIFDSASARLEVEHALQQGRQIILVEWSSQQQLPPLEALSPRLGDRRALRFDGDWDEILTHLQRSTGVQLKVPAMAPQPVSGWVERPRELDRLLEYILPKTTPPPRVLVSGGQGLGKTALVSELCRRPEIARRYPDGVLWADLAPRLPVGPTVSQRGETEVTPQPFPQVVEELVRIHVALTGDTPPVEDARTVADILAERLTARRCLLVLDHVSDPASVTHFIRAGQHCGVVLTTDETSLAVDFRVDHLQVGGLAEDERLMMLRSRLPAGISDHILQRLSERLPNSPRAIVEAARKLSEQAPHGVKAVETAAESIVRGLSDEARAALDTLSPTERQALNEIAQNGGTAEIEISAISEKLSNKDSAAATALRLISLGLLQLNSERRTLRMEPQLAEFLLRPATAAAAHAGPVATAVAKADELIKEAQAVLRGGDKPPKELLQLAKELKGYNQFGYARRLLARARSNPESNRDAALRRVLVQQHALCTYKDPDVLLADRLERALEILREGDSLDETEDQETLGIAGAIFKRKWEAEGQRAHQEVSLGYYLRGAQQGLASDFGYTAINAAFLLDCLAEQEEQAAQPRGTSAPSAQARRAQAAQLRAEILHILPDLPNQRDHQWLGTQYWFFATLGEAAFGRREYQAASRWFARALETPKQPWELETTARQLATLARMQAEPGTGRNPESLQVLREFLGCDAAAESFFIGKVGLSLSGGGFRASLFHIGVLARLAELDLLRSVEVLSCVSGGSIIGAHYYLELRHLLQTKEDAEITRDNYIDLVRRVEKDFLAGVQRNIRTRVAAGLMDNLRMILSPNHSRSQRAGDLFEREIFARVNDGAGDKPRLLRDLLIQPKGEEPGFNPKHSNWQRRAKVPILILNATTLNTGHNWQFTATYMGEPPGAIDPEVDGNDRLRRMYYTEAPEHWRDLSLGHAVAASACVPGLFEPLELADLYPEMTVRLVDGGVHDNQGIAGLLEQDATFLLVSDASGQTAVQREPSKSTLGVPLRSNDILMARVRGAQFRQLSYRRRAGLLRRLMFLHLKKDLDVDPVDWNDCKDPFNASEEQARPAARRGPLTSYEIRKDMQERLAALRTDLDSFNDAEAFSLMTSGYRMTQAALKDDVPPTVDRPAADPQPWRFLEVEKYLNLSKGFESGGRALLNLLELGQHVAFKIWFISPPLQVLGVVLGLLAAIAVAAVCWFWRSTPLLTLGTVGTILLVLATSTFLGSAIVRAANFRGEVARIVRAVIVSIAGWLLAKLHLAIFDPMFLEAGRLESLDRRRSLRLGKRLGGLIGSAFAVLFFVAWLIYQSDTYQRSALLRRAPVAEALRTRDVGAMRVSDWAQALASINQAPRANEVWTEVISAADGFESERERIDALLTVAADASAALPSNHHEIARAALERVMSRLERGDRGDVALAAVQADAYYRASRLYEQIGPTDVASEARERAVRAAAAADADAQVRLWTTIAGDLSSSNHYEAQRLARMAAEAVDWAAPVDRLATGLSSLSRVFLSLGDRSTARTLLDKGQQAVESAGKTAPDTRTAVVTLSQAYADLGEDIGQTKPNANSEVEYFDLIRRRRFAEALAAISRVPDASEKLHALSTFVAEAARAKNAEVAGQGLASALETAAGLNGGARIGGYLNVAAAAREAGSPQDARKACEHAETAIEAYEAHASRGDVSASYYRSRLADEWARLGNIRHARQIADTCSLAADRLGAYADILRQMPR